MHWMTTPEEQRRIVIALQLAEAHAIERGCSVNVLDDLRPVRPATMRRGDLSRTIEVIRPKDFYR